MIPWHWAPLVLNFKCLWCCWKLDLVWGVSRSTDWKSWISQKQSHLSQNVVDLPLKSDEARFLCYEFEKKRSNIIQDLAYSNSLVQLCQLTLDILYKICYIFDEARCDWKAERWNVIFSWIKSVSKRKETHTHKKAVKPATLAES